MRLIFINNNKETKNWVHNMCLLDDAYKIVFRVEHVGVAWDTDTDNPNPLVTVHLQPKGGNDPHRLPGYQHSDPNGNLVFQFCDKDFHIENLSVKEAEDKYRQANL